MMHLIKIEWLKLKGHRFFWIGLGLYLMLTILLLVFFGDIGLFGKKPDNGTPAGMPLTQTFGEAGFYTIPYIWQNTAYVAGFFKVIPVFLVIFFLTNEYQYRTFRQNIIDGLTLRQFFWSKMSGVLLISLVSVLAIGLTTLALALYHNDSTAWSQLFHHVDYLLGLFLELLFMMSLGFFFGVLFKRSAVSIILILLYYYLVEPALSLALSSSIAQYLPSQPSRNMIEQPFTRMLQLDMITGEVSATNLNWNWLLWSAVYSALFFLASYFTLSRRDI